MNTQLNKIQTEAVKLLVGLVSKGMRQGIYSETEIIMFNGIIKCFIKERLPAIQEEEEQKEEPKYTKIKKKLTIKSLESIKQKMD